MAITTNISSSLQCSRMSLTEMFAFHLVDGTDSKNFHVPRVKLMATKYRLMENSVHSRHGLK